MDYRVFLTDYASYNNGTQFEFGHWVDLTNFVDGSEFLEYVRNHFKEADKKSPLCSPREEIMITDIEGIPSELYSESGMNWDIVMEYVNMEECEQISFEILLQQGYDAEYASSHYDDIYPILDIDIDNYVQDYLDEYYGEKFNNNIFNTRYITIEYDLFKQEAFTEYDTMHGKYYIFD